MKPLRIYIAGPMTGLPDLNRASFAAAAEEIKALGHEPVNPHDLHPGEVTWEQAMRVDIAALVKCDAVLMLEHWSFSRGATLEHHIASRLSMPVAEAPHLLSIALVRAGMAPRSAAYA
jgi:hypothetical protein